MLKKLFAIALNIYLLFGFFNIAFAQTTGQDYTKAGVSEQIRQYLCAPSSDQSAVINNQNTTTVGYGTNTAANGDLYTCINRLYKFAIVIGGVVGVFFIVIAGYLYMGAGGNDESITKAKDILTTTITSLVILFAGFILLKAINPDLIQFRSIQPPSVTLEKAQEPSESQSGEPAQVPTGLSTNPLNNASGGTIAQLQSAGCNITSEARPRNELPNLVSPLWAKLLQICQISSQNGFKPTVSSTVRRESTGSYHQKGCAVDFADGGGNGFFDIKTHSGRALALYNAAKQAGINESRINPGVDQNQSYHLHIDLGTQCSN
jgi:hypothetical protein